MLLPIKWQLLLMEMLNFKDVLAFGFYEAHSPHTVAVLALL